MADISVHVPAGHAWRGQLPHLILLAALLPGAWAMAGDSLGDGTYRGIPDHTWFAAAIAIPVVHQVLVALVWRTQLATRWVTRVLGETGFRIWIALFVPLLIARPLLVFAVGMADRGSLELAPAPAYGIAAVLLLPALWTLHSVIKYFGIPRAVGGDHFFERYRAMPMVRAGAFKYSSNAMYTFVFAGQWGLALLLQSRAALAVAVFQHAYIWVHWYCTEEPDSVVLYGHAADED